MTYYEETPDPVEEPENLDIPWLSIYDDWPYDAAAPPEDEQPDDSPQSFTVRMVTDERGEVVRYEGNFVVGGTVVACKHDRDPEKVLWWLRWKARIAARAAARRRQEAV